MNTICYESSAYAVIAEYLIILYLCVSFLLLFVRIGGGGAWSSKGCELVFRNSTHISCQCNHMTSFAVLMDISKREVGHSQLVWFIWNFASIQPANWFLNAGISSLAWWCSSSESGDLHHSVRLSGCPPHHLPPAGHSSQAALQLTQHPQELGGSYLPLWTHLPHWHQSDRQSGEQQPEILDYNINNIILHYYLGHFWY